MKKLGWGVIGCGVISPWHIYGVNRAKDAQLIAVSDVIEEKAKKLAEKEKVAWYTDYARMLERDDVDVVSICTPSSFHCKLTIAAVRAGKHILVEKPMAITLEDADRMIEATTSVYPSTIPHRIEIHGEKGTIMIEGEAIARWEIMGKDGAPIDKIGKTKEAPKAVTSPTDFSMEEHVRQIADMVEAVKEDREPLVNGVEGRKSVEIILSIYHSSKTKKAVKLPLG